MMHGILQQLVQDAQQHPDASDRLFWIDSICINQKDADEKGEQIPLMTTIYKSAARVVAFPPPLEREPTDLALAGDFLDLLSVYLLARCWGGLVGDKANLLVGRAIFPRNASAGGPSYRSFPALSGRGRGSSRRLSSRDPSRCDLAAKT